MTVTGLVVPYSPEYRDLAANDFLMTQLAQAGGGVMETNPAQAFGGNRPSVYSAVDLSQWLLLLAMLLFPVDVGVRRLALDRSDFGRAWDWLRARFGPSPRRIPGRAASTPELAGLMSAKQRALAGVGAGASGESVGVREYGGVGVAAQPGVATTTRPHDPTTRSVPRPHDPTTWPATAARSTTQPQAPEFVLDEPEPAATEDGVGGMSRLMAAKRRAREQQEKRDSGE
jgi:hypothetical protein